MSRSPTLKEKHPELFLPDTNVDPKTRKRVVPMQVLSLGMPRTGTASMQLALNILGFPCYHGLSLLSNLRDCAMWNEALDAKFFNKGQEFSAADWDSLLGNYSAVADLPAVAFPEELITAYPDAKVVLVERDIEKWYKSFDEGVMQNVWNPVLRLITKLDWNFVGKLEGVSKRGTLGWLQVTSLAETQRNAVPKYRVKGLLE